jgi:hypothetical protein
MWHTRLVTITVRKVERDPLAIGVAIMTVHAGWRADQIEGDRRPMVEDLADDHALAHGFDDADLLALAELGEAEPDTGPGCPPRRLTDGQIILDLIGHDPTAEEVGELIVALGMLGAILAEEAGEASGRPASAVLREIALRYVA